MKRLSIFLLATLTLVVLCAGPETKARQTRVQGPLAMLPSAVAGNEGLVVRVVLPERERYSEGAPVVVHVPGGYSLGSVDSSRGRLASFGFLEVLFLFPGGQSAPQSDGKVWESGGVYDYRGEECVQALADVLAFAQGLLRTVDGRTIQDLAGRTRVLRENVGVIGWSLGGNIVPASLAHDANVAAGVRWYASWESPYGDGVINGEFGTRIDGPNPFYDPVAGELDLRNLRYDPDLAQTLLPPPQDPMPEVTGSLYHDANGNGRYDHGVDVKQSGVPMPGPPPNFYYSRAMTAWAAEQDLFRDQWPQHIAAPEDVEEFLDIRDGETQVPEAVRNSPELAVIVWASEVDHVQRTEDHRHIRVQYEAFLDAGVRWARLNPDANYLRWVTGTLPPGVVQNPAGERFDTRTIGGATEPSGFYGQGLVAAACELADRTERGEWSSTLQEVLFPDAPRLEFRGPPSAQVRHSARTTGRTR
jgi:dienelactone hydrolase